MTDLIKRADALAYPIRINHYDKEHGNLHFVLGIESVMEYIENLPSAKPTSDLISRTDAIEELCTMMVDCFDADEEVIDAIRTTMNEISSAETEAEAVREISEDCKPLFFGTDYGKLKKKRW